MKNKMFYIGLIVGIAIGGAPSSIAYYSSYTTVAELKVDDLKQIISESVNNDDLESTLRRVLNRCTLRQGFGDSLQLSC